MAHTPGPWNYQAGQVFTEWRQKQGASLFHLFICSVATTQHDNVEANGKLIAAAPDMYDLLDRIYNMLLSATFIDCFDPEYAEIMDLLDSIRHQQGAHEATPPQGDALT